MKKTFLYMMLSTILLSLGSCTSNELEVLDTPTGKGTYTVNFKMSNPSKAKSRAYDHLESDINQLYAVVFDGTNVTDLNALAYETVKGVYQVTATPNGTAGTDGSASYDCSFTMDQTGTFVVCFVANANTELVNAMKGAASVTAFKQLMASQAPETFLMVSTDFKKFSLSGLTEAATWDGTTTTQEVTMKRTVARIDIKNSVDGLTIHSISFANRAIQTELWNDNRTTTDAIYLEKEKVYTINTTTHTLNPGSSSGTPGTHYAEIYTYEQHDVTTNKPSLKFTYALDGVEYTDGDSDGTPDYPNDLTLEFKRTKDNVDTYVPLQRNYKYTVNITMVNNKFRFTIEVLDWETGETFTLTPENLVDEETEQRKDQATMNQALKVYDLFTEFNVKSVNATGDVTFYDALTNNPDAPATCQDDVEKTYGYYTYAEALKVNEALKKANSDYRLPTMGELSLLLPIHNTQNNITVHPYWNDCTTTGTANSVGYTMIEGEYSETLYLDEDLSTGYWNNANAISGWSQMKRGTETVTDFKYSGNNKFYDIAPVYAYRFKGTEHFAAYRWETIAIYENNENRYFSIKIKALDNYYDADITIDQIASEDFWKEGEYFEYRFPASGFYTVVKDKDDGTKTGGTLAYRGFNGYCWSSSRHSATNARGLFFYLDNASVYNYNVGGKFPLRLVKVSQE